MRAYLTNENVPPAVAGRTFVPRTGLHPARSLKAVLPKVPPPRMRGAGTFSFVRRTGLRAARSLDGGLTQSPSAPHARGWDIFICALLQGRHARPCVPTLQMKMSRRLLPAGHLCPGWIPCLSATSRQGTSTSLIW